MLQKIKILQKFKILLISSKIKFHLIFMISKETIE